MDSYLGIDIPNAVEQMAWPEVQRKPLLPVFEAIHNSIQSIREADVQQGEIIVNLTRKENDLEPACITKIIIEDNGHGFSEENVQSFARLFSTRKNLSFNGKGIGRLAFFALFSKVKIKSTFETTDGVYMFNSVVTEKKLQDVLNVVPTLAENSTIKTSIELFDIKTGRENVLRIPESTVRSILSQHFLPSLLSERNIRIKINDGESYYLDYNYKDVISGSPIRIGSELFSIYFLKNRANHNSSHKIILSADGRSVKDIPLSFLPKGKIGEDSDRFYLTVVVVSEYLNKRLNAQRSDFNIPSTKGLDETLISMDTIISAVGDSAKVFCKNNIERLEESLEKIIENTFDELPHLSFLRKDPEARRELKLGDDAATVKSIYIKRFAEKQVESFNFVKAISRQYESDKIPSFEEFEHESLSRLEEGMKLNHAPLISYIKYRDYVINLYSKLLESVDGKHYQPEKVLHSLLFPTKTESADCVSDYHHHNLWLIDDRYAMYDYITSDQEEYKISQSTTQRDDKRYDICAAYADPIGAGHNVFIVELKRPCKALSADNDPVEQIKNYTLRMMRGKLRNENFTRINITESTQFYGLILCDVNNDYFNDTMIMSHSLKKRPDGRSFHTVLLNDRLFLEIMNYEGLLAISRARNQVFMDKLNKMD